MRKYLDLFDKMVSELKAHPEIEVYHYKKNPPITEKSLDKLLKKFPHLPSELIHFFKECNGLFLEWGLKSKKEEYTITKKAFGDFDYGTPPGRINILKAEKIFSRDWMDTLYVDDNELWEIIYGKRIKSPDNLEDCLFVFDYFSYYDLTAILTGPTLYLLIATDHGADTYSTHYVSFENYIKMTLSLYGLSRFEFGLETRNQKKKEIVWDKTYTLDALIKKIK